MNDKKDAYLAIDMGGTFLKSVVADKNGHLFTGSQFKTPSHSGQSKDKIIESIRRCISHSLNFIHAAERDLKKIGVAIPGPFDYKKGVFLMEHKFQEVYGENLKGLIADILTTGTHIPVCCVHDANVVLTGELWKGRARLYKNAAVVTLGTGIGFAHSLNRVVQCTALGSPSVTIYKEPYKDGILEDYVSQRGILKIYTGQNPHRTPDNFTVLDIAKQADNGYPPAIRTFRMIGEILSASLVRILPEKKTECLLLGGQISHAYKHIEETLNAGLAGANHLQYIAPVEHIEQAAFYGLLWYMNYA